MTKSLFVATPISAFSGEADLRSFKHRFVQFIEVVRSQLPDVEIFSEVLDIDSQEDYDDPASSAVKDFASIERCSHFMLVYPSPTASSALIELGFALALEKPVLVIAESLDDLPSVVRLRYEQGEGVQLVLFGDEERMATEVVRFLKQ